MDLGERYADSVLCFPSEMAKGMHATQKPLSLFRFLILSYTNPGDLILDNCMDSGTTGVACVQTERNFIGIEKEKEYFNLADQRIKTEKNKNKDQTSPKKCKNSRLVKK